MYKNLLGKEEEGQSGQREELVLKLGGKREKCEEP